MSPFRLDGKVAIVTGAARGQGVATARLFVEQGAKVILTDILDEEGQAAAEAIGSAAEYRRLDITDERDWGQATADIVGRHGRIDILINNAGATNATAFLDLTADGLRKTLDINLVGAFLGMQAVIPAMIDAGGGAIVNISSVNGLRGTASCAAYDAAKWSIRGMSKSVALEFAGRGIRVNSLHPGAIDTPMLNPGGGLDMAGIASQFNLPIGRVGAPEEVARASLFLASEAASYITGAELAVDGGWTAGIHLGGVENYR